MCQLLIILAFFGQADKGPDIVIINRSGPHRLTRTVNQVIISASNVVLDLNGHTVDCEGGDGNGIEFTSFRTGIVIRNGFVRSCGGHGIAGFQALRSVIEDVQVTACHGVGIELGEQGRARGCLSTSNDGDGFRAYRDAIVMDCMSHSNGGNGFNQLGGSGLYTNCVASANSQDGIRLSGIANIVSRCTVKSNSGNGISLATNSICRGNTVVSAGKVGIQVTTNTLVQNNLIAATVNHGLQAGSGNTISGNQMSQVGWENPVADGVHVVGSGNTIRNNSVLQAGRYSVYVEGPRNLTVGNLAVGAVLPNTDFAFIDDQFGAASNMYGPVMPSMRVMRPTVSGAANFGFSQNPGINNAMDLSHERCQQRFHETFGVECAAYYVIHEREVSAAPDDPSGQSGTSSADLP